MNTFYNKSKLMTGERALSNIPHELKVKNLNKPLVISEKMEAYPSFYKPIKKAFDNDKIKIPSILVYRSNLAEVNIINEYVEEYKAIGADSIIAVGREAVISVAKMVKLAIEQGVKDVRNIESISTPRQSVPLFVVPVFFGSGDESRGRARCYDDNTSYDFVSDTLMPDATIIDKAMICKPSRSVMASSIMYALSSALIAYTDKSSGIMTSSTAMAAIMLLCNSINDREFKRKPMEFATNIATSVVIAGMALDQVKDDKLATISDIVSRHIRLPYSKVYSMLFPHYYEQIIDRNDIAYMEVLLPIIGEERYSLTPINKRAEEVVKAIRTLIDYLGDSSEFRYNLSDYKMKRDDIEPLARKIADSGIDYDLVLTTLNRTF